jgi:hypothetical protein
VLTKEYRWSTMELQGQGKEDVKMLKELDERTAKYFETIKKEKGHIGTNCLEETGIRDILKKKGVLDAANLQQIDTYDGYANSSDINIYSYELSGAKRYCAEFSFQTDIDAFYVETIIFTKIPSREDVLLIRGIEDLRLKFEFGRLKPEYTCWECGRKVHWLDRPGDFETKMAGLEERYCGC